jgi:hypothetical protein
MSEQWLTPRQVAREFGLSDVAGRNVCVAIGEQDNSGHWRVRTDDVWRHRLTRAVGAEKAARLRELYLNDPDVIGGGRSPQATQITEAEANL